MGRETALTLHHRGINVYAAARHSMPELKALGIRTLSMDVSSERSMVSGVNSLLDETDGRIDILINNAGYGSYGAIEDLPISEARKQFEVNVFGAMRLVQLVLPPMADAHSGRIVNISSVGGRFAMALGGWYHATKYAIEALSDSLRQEVRDLGIDVVIVEPGFIRTNWPGIAAVNLRKVSGLGRYKLIAEGLAAALDLAVDKNIGTAAAPLGDLIARAATCPNPRTRYKKGTGALALTTLTGLLPDRVFDGLIHASLIHLKEIVAMARQHTRSSQERRYLLDDIPRRGWTGYPRDLSIP